MFDDRSESVETLAEPQDNQVKQGLVVGLKNWEELIGQILLAYSFSGFHIYLSFPSLLYWYLLLSKVNVTTTKSQSPWWFGGTGKRKVFPPKSFWQSRSSPLLVLICYLQQTCDSVYSCSHKVSLGRNFVIIKTKYFLPPKLIASI